MPIYEFECRGCGRRFEHLILPWKETETNATACPSCQSTDVERLLSVFAVNSESVRQMHLKTAREKARAIKKEKDTAEFHEIMEHAGDNE